MEIYQVKGSLEKSIRNAYYVGSVHVCYNEINWGYYYDMNSQYPYGMLQGMPVGKAILTNEKDISKIFGFVYGTVTASTEDILKIPIIQSRDDKGNAVCPRGIFKRMILS